MAKPPKKNGRPSKHTKAIENEVIKRITNGEAVTSICDDPRMPNRNTWFDWVSKIEGLSNRYAEALHTRTHLYAETRHKVIDDAIAQLKDMPEGVNVNVFGNLIKEKVRAIEWDAERLAAKKYKIFNNEQNNSATEDMADALFAIADKLPS